jgi:hypothetical protein
VTTILIILLWLVIIIVIVLAGLIFTPLKLRVRATTLPHLAYRVEASTLGGWSPAIPIVDSTRPREAKVKKKQKKVAQKTRRRQISGSPRIVSAVPDLLTGLLGTFHFDRLSIEAEFGLFDPADTGQLYGFIAPLQFGVPPGPKSLVSLRPNFERACFNGAVDASVHFTPVAFLRPAIRFAWRAFGPGQ